MNIRTKLILSVGVFGRYDNPAGSPFCCKSPDTDGYGAG